MAHDPAAEIAALRASRDEAYEQVAAAEHRVMRLAEERDALAAQVAALTKEIADRADTEASLTEQLAGRFASCVRCCDEQED